MLWSSIVMTYSSQRLGNHVSYLLTAKANNTHLTFDNILTTPCRQLLLGGFYPEVMDNSIIRMAESTTYGSRQEETVIKLTSAQYIESFVSKDDGSKMTNRGSFNYHCAITRIENNQRMIVHCN